MKKLPIIYSDEYNIRLFGIQKIHPFDTEKYAKVFKFLTQKLGIPESAFYPGEPVNRDILLKVHTKRYLDSLKSSAEIARIAELPLLRLVPNIILRQKFLKPMKYATGGTILGAKLALKFGWAINLSGGYHHAKSDASSGFCFYADIPLAILLLWDEDKNKKILIIDLDAHQGNGLAAIFKNDKRIGIMDVYNKDIYPGDSEAGKYIDFDYPLSSNIEDAEYLSIIQSSVSRAIKKINPDLLIYNAGTDIYEKDLLGKFKITQQGIIKRDEIVFQSAKKLNIPILMVLSGGYHRDSGSIIGKSIENILKNILKIYDK